MSYLRGPLTREEISRLDEGEAGGGRAGGDEGGGRAERPARPATALPPPLPGPAVG